MPVDMVPARFFDELDVLEPFERRGKYDATIQRFPLPPKQAFSPGLFLFNHSAGYRLPAWEDFNEDLCRAGPDALLMRLLDQLDRGDVLRFPTRDAA